MADLNFFAVDGVGSGGYAPLDRFTQDGTNLWFTTKSGGTFDAGTVSRYDLVTREVVEVASLDNNTGKAPESALLILDGEGFFTTVNGGTGNKGTIAKINLTNGAITVLHHFSTNLTTGATPRAGLTRIGDELWTLTSLGGESNRGVVVQMSLRDYSVSTVTNLDGPVLGGQPFDGLARLGNDYYFVTFSGGATFKATNYVEIPLPDGAVMTLTNSTPLGAGTLGRLSFAADGTPVVASVASVPGGYEQFLACAPTPVGTNSLYFTSVGPNALPGAILRYDLDTGAVTNLYRFPTNAESALAVGTRPGYSGLTEWLGELYFINRSGGVSNAGVVAKFNLASHTVTKLADLEDVGANSLGSASGFFGAGTLVEENGRAYLYYPLTSGGANDRGTIIRVALPPPPIQLAIASAAEGAQLSWTGGYPPFAVQSCAALGGEWKEVASGLTNRAFTAGTLRDAEFFRVVGAK